MEIAGDMHDCRLWAPAGFQIADGEMAEVLGIFIRPDLAMPKLSKQCGFTLWDGGTIGHGELLEVLPADESQDS